MGRQQFLKTMRRVTLTAPKHRSLTVICGHRGTSWRHPRVSFSVGEDGSCGWYNEYGIQGIFSIYLRGFRCMKLWWGVKRNCCCWWGHRAQQSLSVDRSVWVTRGRSVTLGRGTGNLRYSLVSTLLFGVIISQVGIENSTVLINLQILRGSGALAPGIFRVPRLASFSIVWALFYARFFYTRETPITCQPPIAERQTQHLSPEADQRSAAAGRPFPPHKPPTTG